MKKNYLLGILFLGGLWGLSEASLGNVLYRAEIPYSSVPLTIIALTVLALGKVYFPQAGSATLIALCAMVYKFLNVPFFACHLLGILITGISFDLFFSVLKIRNRSISAAAATYLSYALFALMITYVFRYQHWVEGGLIKVLKHIAVTGSMSALGCAAVVPLAFRMGELLKTKPIVTRVQLGRRLAPWGISLATMGLWAFSIVVFLQRA